MKFKIFSIFTFYNIYIKTEREEYILPYQINLHSTIFILKPSFIFSICFANVIYILQYLY